MFAIEVFQFLCLNLPHKITVMSKERSVKKESKKAPAKTLKEKREAKKLKKLAKGS